MAYQEARAKLPADAAWFCSFGNPGDGGYVEYWHTPSGRRFTLQNGPWDDYADTWSVTER